MDYTIARPTKRPRLGQSSTLDIQTISFADNAIQAHDHIKNSQRYSLSHECQDIRLPVPSQHDYRATDLHDEHYEMELEVVSDEVSKTALDPGDLICFGSVSTISLI